MSFLAATLGLGLAGVIGMYGTLVGPWRNDAPAPVDQGPRRSPRLCWACSAAPTPGITPDVIAAFEAALASAGVEHRLVTYPGAPHSFFDRKATEFADASAAAWEETLGFIADPEARRRPHAQLRAATPIPTSQMAGTPTNANVSRATAGSSLDGHATAG